VTRAWQVGLVSALAIVSAARAAFAQYAPITGRGFNLAANELQPTRDAVTVRLGVDAELRVFELDLWGRHRLSISAAGDWAERYDAFAISLGFWD
jgi:hypothetical protein